MDFLEPQAQAGTRFARTAVPDASFSENFGEGFSAPHELRPAGS